MSTLGGWAGHERRKAKRNDPDCSGSAVRCRSRARRPGVHPPLHEILKNYLMWDSISLFTDGRRPPTRSPVHLTPLAQAYPSPRAPELTCPSPDLTCHGTKSPRLHRGWIAASRLAARASRPVPRPVSPCASLPGPSDPRPIPGRVGGHREVSTDPRVDTIRSFGGEPLHYNSRHPQIAEALVRTFKLLLKGFDVKPIVPAADCLSRRSQHPLKLSLEPIQVCLRQVSVAIDCPLQPPRPGPIGIIHYGVENLLALGIEELGRDKLPGKVDRPWPLATE